MNENNEQLQNEEIQPNYTETLELQLRTDTWAFFGSYRNLLPVKVRITNLEGPSYIMAKIVDSTGEPIITSSTGLLVGQTSSAYPVKSSQSPYSVYLKAGQNGTYTVKVTDQN